MLPYIIFALPRTGSTTLLNLLNCRAGLRCFFEPFNPTNANDFLAQCSKLRLQKGLFPVVEALWRNANGFKHVWDIGGFPFPDNPDLNRQLLLGSGAKIILMHRKNKLRRAISVQISLQMQLWILGLPEHFDRIRNHQFTALDIPSLQKEIDDATQAITWARAELEAHDVPMFEVAYEDLFEKTLSLESRMCVLNSILDFIGVGPETDPERLALMHKFFDPATSGFQNAESYWKIPNIHEVDAALSSPENGFVFDPPAPSDFLSNRV